MNTPTITFNTGAPPYEKLCVVDIKNHRAEFGIYHKRIDDELPDRWEVYGDGAGLEGDVVGWALLPDGNLKNNE